MLPGIGAETGSVCAGGRISRLLPAQPVHPTAGRRRLPFTGIHGDEPAGPEALATWAETRLPALARSANAPPLMILPCLNPWGLVNNQRTDQHARDLNRLFDRANLAPIRELKRLLTGWRFDFGLSLHEDFDARGIYGYEFAGKRTGFRLGAGAVMGVFSRHPHRPATSDRWPGVHRWTNDPPSPDSTYPRACGDDLSAPAKADNAHLHLETPSEFSLTRRVQAHVLLIEECMQRLRA